ncbi:MAG: DUF2723 domain-containing protein [Polyangia bacterium]|jgi:hypothetical protein|nr:DUF2723 domain-containing protein [Polyangia bacterium]
MAAAAVLLYFVATMSRDLSFYDSAELAMVAVQGGLGHPLGQPLHSLLGWLVTRLPWISPLLLLNLLSAIFSALAVIPLVSLAEGLAGPGTPTALGATRGSDPGMPSSRAELVIPLGVGLLFIHPVFWDNGTRVEVYALAFALGAWGLGRVAASLVPRPEGGGGWLAAGVALGLAASANAYIAFLVALGITPAIVLALLRRRLRIISLLRVIGGGILGLLPFLYIPLTASREDVFVWGAPTGGEALSRYLSNADFAHNRGMTLGVFFEHLLEWSGWALSSGLLPLLALGLFAHLHRGHRAGIGRGFGAIALLAAIYFLCINVIFFPEVSDYLGYLSLPAGVLGAGAVALVCRGLRSHGSQRWLMGVLGAALLVSIAGASPRILERTRHRDRLARVLSEGALENAPPNAVVLVSSDHWAFPMLYLQEVERRRKDVVVLPLGLSGASWYWAHLFRRHPELRPFVLRASGGRVGRIQRFLAANPGRPLLFEDFATAMAHGPPACPGRWLIADKTACEQGGSQGPDLLTLALERQVDRIGAGSPPAAAVIARVSLERGELLWRYGQPAEALRALRAGVPSALRPPLPPGIEGRLGLAGRLSAPPLEWRSPVLIGHYSRNLHLASRLLSAAGAKSEARAHLEVAARAGLPEALEALAKQN